jgi:hypothetical protein
MTVDPANGIITGVDCYPANRRGRYYPETFGTAAERQ